jgi:hypothetical protein
MTEKTIVEEDLKGLEKEIDAAVDRLFVEKRGEPLKSSPPHSPPPRIFEEKEKEIGWELTPPASSTPSTTSDLLFESSVESVRSEPTPEPPQPLGLEVEEAAPSLPGPVEKLETQLLSLEWEINKENLGKTVEEILRLKRDFSDRPDISTVLNQMAKAIHYMIQNEEGIQPQLIRFLFDSKETIKLLMRKETEDDLSTYKKLACAGIEARFSSLEGVQEVHPKPTVAKADEAFERVEPPPAKPDLEETVMRMLASFSDKLDEMMERMNQHFALHEKTAENQAQPPADAKPLKAKITVFQIGEKLLGVESDRVFKLFRVPVSLRDRFIQPNTVRLNGLEVRIIDLENLFSIPDEDRRQERQILIMKRNGEYKGLVVDKVLNRLSGPLEPGQELNEYLLGMIRWTYQDLPIKVPILNLEKL